jgi:hypothetical protein
MLSRFARRAKCAPLVALAAPVIGLSGLAGSGLSFAHSWYPKVCCQDHDCMKVDHIEHLSDGSMKMQAGTIEVIVPKGFVPQPSLDNDAHVCIMPKMGGGYAPRCVFMPASV